MRDTAAWIALLLISGGGGCFAAGLAERRVRRLRSGAGRAIHDLRGALQPLMLAPAAGADGSQPHLALDALSALEELDRVLNGRDHAVIERTFDPVPLVLESCRRWGAVFREPGPESGETAEAHPVPARPALVVGDPGAVHRVIDNLIRNAAEHGACGPVGPEVALRRVGVSLNLVVRNRTGGVGGPNRRQRPGRGQGLAIVMSIVSEHGGRLAVRETGGRFIASVDLPIADVGDGRSCPDAGRPRSSAGRRARLGAMVR